MATTKDIVKEIVADVMCIKVDAIGDNDSIVKTIGADSLEQQEILLGLESKFGVNITDDEFNWTNTIMDLVVLLEARKKK